jgi:hypothetical protein
MLEVRRSPVRIPTRTFFQLPNHSSRAMAQGLIQSRTEMNLPGRSAAGA